jgi:L-malate glycosyltransferase
MERGKRDILFITPSLASTGSEVLLFNFINFLAGRYNISLICFRRGNLIQLLDKSVTVHILEYTEPKNIFQKIQRRYGLHVSIPKIFSRFKNHLWYINTLTLPLPVKFAVDHGISFVLHVHELNHMYHLLSSQQLNRALNNSTLLIANSYVTGRHLLYSGSIKPAKIVYPFVDLNLISQYKEIKIAGSGRVFSWVMAGSIDKNKDPELFIKIAIQSQLQNLPFRFVWLYQTVTDEMLMDKIIKQLQTQKIPVEFIKTNNYNDYLSMFSKCDGLLLTSTIESFSIVTLEAMALDLALVVNDCGGVTELVNDSFASIVPRNSPPEKYLAMMQHELSRKDPTRSLKNERSLVFDKNVILCKWEDVVLSCIE